MENKLGVGCCGKDAGVCGKETLISEEKQRRVQINWNKREWEKEVGGYTSRRARGELKGSWGV